MSTPDQDSELLVAARALARRVDTLTENLHMAQARARRARILMTLTMVVAVLALAGVIGNGVVYTKVQDSIRTNHATQLVSCQNANQTRAANLALWNFVLNVSSKQPRQGSVSEVQLAKIRAWVTALFAPHDCADLGKVYKIPAPPNIVG